MNSERWRQGTENVDSEAKPAELEETIRMLWVSVLSKVRRQEVKASPAWVG